MEILQKKMIIRLLIILISLISCTQNQNIIDSFELGQKFELSKYNKNLINTYYYTLTENCKIKEYEFHFYDDWYFFIWVNEVEEIVLINVSEMLLLKKPKTYRTKQGYSVYTKYSDLSNSIKEKSIEVPILSSFIGDLYQLGDGWFISFLGYEDGIEYPTGCTCDLFKIDFDYFNNLIN